MHCHSSFDNSLRELLIKCNLNKTERAFKNGWQTFRQMCLDWKMVEGWFGAFEVADINTCCGQTHTRTHTHTSVKHTTHDKHLGRIEPMERSTHRARQVVFRTVCSEACRRKSGGGQWQEVETNWTTFKGLVPPTGCLRHDTQFSFTCSQSLVGKSKDA